MSQIIVKTDSKTTNWVINRRFRVGDSVIHSSSTWVNITGANSEPGIGLDWLFISSAVVAGAKTVISFIATNNQVLHIGAAGIPDDGNWDVIIGSEFQRSRTGNFSNVNGNISINFATGDITFHNPLFGGTGVLIRY